MDYPMRNASKSEVLQLFTYVDYDISNTSFTKAIRLCDLKKNAHPL